MKSDAADCKAVYIILTEMVDFKAKIGYYFGAYPHYFCTNMRGTYGESVDARFEGRF